MRLKGVACLWNTVLKKSVFFASLKCFQTATPPVNLLNIFVGTVMSCVLFAALTTLQAAKVNVKEIIGATIVTRNFLFALKQ